MSDKFHSKDFERSGGCLTRRSIFISLILHFQLTLSPHSMHHASRCPDPRLRSRRPLAAIDLARAGLKVEILEARDRIGGRIFTKHDDNT